MADNATVDGRRSCEAGSRGKPQGKPLGKPIGRAVDEPQSADSPESRQRLAKLVADHHADVYRYALRLSGSVYDAEDLTQQTFLAAQRKVHQLRDPGSGRSWLFTILRHTYVKGCARHRPVPAASLEFDIDAVPAEAPEADLFDLTDIDRDALQVALDELPTEFKLVVLMFYFEECSYRDIALRLGLPMGTVMSRLSRAKGHLRNRLAAAAPRREVAPLATS